MGFTGILFSKSVETPCRGGFHGGVKKGGKTVKQLGKNTHYIRSKEVLKGKNHYQWVCVVQWGNDTADTTTGYSDLQGKTDDRGEASGNKKKAFFRAHKAARDIGIFKYDWTLEPDGPTQGRVVSPNGKEIIFYKAQYHAQTYINTTQKRFIPQRDIVRT